MSCEKIIRYHIQVFETRPKKRAGFFLEKFSNFAVEFILDIADNAGQHIVDGDEAVRAAEFMSDIVAGRPRSGVMSGLECFQFELADRYVLTVVANHVPPRLDGDGRTDWSRVRRVKVVSVEAMQ